MSQIYKTAAPGPPPPPVPTTFVTDVNSPAIPAVNILNVIGGDTAANNDVGLQTDGSSGGNNLTIQLTNRMTALTTTMDGTPTIMLTFPLSAVAGVYYLEGDLVAFDVTDAAGAAYSFSSAVRSTGVAATEIGTEFKDLFEEPAISAADFSISASGNTVIVTVTGILGKIIDWNCFLMYRFVS